MNRVFNATLDAVSTNKTKTVIKLSLSNKEAAVFAQRYLNSIDKELRVSFDDPQMEMDLAPASGNSRGLVATISHNGVVESAHRENDDDQGDLFEQESSEESEYEGEQESEEKIEGEEGTDKSEETDEVKFEDGDAPTDSDPVDEEEDDDAPEPEEIEAFILSEKPIFESIPYNFPELIRQRREENASWMKLSRDAGIPSAKMQAVFRDYKKLVIAQMREQGVA